MMYKHNWTPAQIDEMDAHYYFELVEYQNTMKNPKEKRNRKRRAEKVVPIDAVF